MAPSSIKSDIMKIDALTPDNAILREMGRRLAQQRKQHGYSQSQLAEEAGIGIATLKRIEAGDGSQLESWLKLLKALQMVSSIDRFIPESLASPMAQAMERAARNYKLAPSAKRWGDEAQ